MAAWASLVTVARLFSGVAVRQLIQALITVVLSVLWGAVVVVATARAPVVQVAMA